MSYEEGYCDNCCSVWDISEYGYECPNCDGEPNLTQRVDLSQSRLKEIVANLELGMCENPDCNGGQLEEWYQPPSCDYKLRVMSGKFCSECKGLGFVIKLKENEDEKE